MCRRERKIYFEKLDVAAIRCNLTLIPRPGGGQRDADAGVNSSGAPMGAASRFRLSNVIALVYVARSGGCGNISHTESHSVLQPSSVEAI